MWEVFWKALCRASVRWLGVVTVLRSPLAAQLLPGQCPGRGRPDGVLSMRRDLFPIFVAISFAYHFAFISVLMNAALDDRLHHF